MGRWAAREQRPRGLLSSSELRTLSGPEPGRRARTKGVDDWPPVSPVSKIHNCKVINFPVSRGVFCKLILFSSNFFVSFDFFL